MAVPGAVRSSIHLVGEERHLVVMHFDSRSSAAAIHPRARRRMSAALCSPREMPCKNSMRCLPARVVPL
jgi:hypothetical protein